MSNLPANGIYHIINYNTGKYFDLEVGNVAPGTPVIGWTGHCQANQQWGFEREGKICTIKTNLPGRKVFITTEQHVQYAKVVTGKRERFEILEHEPGKYRLKVLCEDLYFSLSGAINGSQVQLRYPGADNDLWVFGDVKEVDRYVDLEGNL